MSSARVLYIAIGNSAAHSWQDLPSPRMPAGTDVKVTFDVRGIGKDKIQQALNSMGATNVRVGVNVEAVFSRQNTPALRGKPVDDSLVLSFGKTDINVCHRLRELLGLLTQD